jgi:hypothetical protein
LSFSHSKVVAWVSLIGVGLFSATAHAATVWDEAANGDLSNDGLAPTPLVAGVGSNVILGATGNSGQGVDRDYFKFTVPAGAALTQIILLPNTSVSGSVSFIGMQPGPELTVTPSGGGVERLLALGHYGNDQTGTDLLPAIKIGSPGPLPSGTYSVWIQDTGGPASYGFDFVMTSLAPPAPAPALRDWGALLLGLLLPISYVHEAVRLKARRVKALAAAEHRGC